MIQGMNVIDLVKDSERYVFLYDDESAAALLKTFGRYAADKELGFVWYDAAVLSQKVRKLQRVCEKEREAEMEAELESAAVLARQKDLRDLGEKVSWDIIPVSLETKFELYEEFAGSLGLGP